MYTRDRSQYQFYPHEFVEDDGFHVWAFFAVALEPSKNITNNPTCDWQLRLYSKRNT
jgi:hypothetical protein